MNKKCIFIQECPPFGDEFFLTIGLSYDETIQSAKKLGASKKFFESMKNAREENDWDNHLKNDFGGVFHNADTNHVFLMRFGNWGDNWDFWEKLLHECCHVVQSLERSKKLDKEDECRAYVTEYLFRNIRRKLMGKENYIGIDKFPKK